jgi:hypothetical protein
MNVTYPERFIRADLENSKQNSKQTRIVRNSCNKKHLSERDRWSKLRVEIMIPTVIQLKHHINADVKHPRYFRRQLGGWGNGLRLVGHVKQSVCPSHTYLTIYPYYMFNNSKHWSTLADKHWCAEI